jgi:hypothetical protein
MEDIKQLITSLENAFANFLSAQTQGEKDEHKALVLNNIAALHNVSSSGAGEAASQSDVETSENTSADDAAGTSDSGVTTSAS